MECTTRRRPLVWLGQQLRSSQVHAQSPAETGEKRQGEAALESEPEGVYPTGRRQDKGNGNHHRSYKDPPPNRAGAPPTEYPKKATAESRCQRVHSYCSCRKPRHPHGKQDWRNKSQEED